MWLYLIYENSSRTIIADTRYVPVTAQRLSRFEAGILKKSIYPRVFETVNRISS